MKWLKRLLLGLLFTLLLLVAAVGVLVGTQPGVGWLVQLAERLVPGELKVAEVEGTLLGDLRLAGLGYANPDMQVQVGEVILRWRPWELLHRRFHVQELSAREVNYEALTVSEEEPPEPLELPDLELPIEIVLDRLRVEKVELVTAPQAVPLIIDEAELSAGWDSSGVKLSGLSLKMPEVTLASSGQLRPQGDYPLGLQLQWELQTEDLPKVSGRGELSGDLKKLVIRHEFSGDLDATLEASLQDLLGTLGWDADLVVDRLPAQYLAIEVPEDLQIRLKADGDLRDARLEMTLDGTPVKGGDAEKMLLNLLGEVALAEQKFDLKGEWKNLQWPLAGVAQVVAESGTLQASGVPDDYRFSLQAKVQGKDVPEGEWNLKGSGNLQQAELETLSGKTLDGQVQANGKVAWQPALGWELQAVLSGIDPGQLKPEWPGKLDLELVSRAETRNDRLQMEAVLKKLQGTLNDKPVSGSGTFRMAGSEITLDQVRIASGSATLDANGGVGQSWDLGWQLSVPDLGDLLPGGEGSVQGSGRLEGTADKPVVKGRLAVRELHYQETNLAQADADFSVGLDESFSSNVKITGNGMRVAGQVIETLDLALQGPLSRHTITLDLKHQLAVLQLGAQGGYQKDKAGWSGTLEKLSLLGETLGDWKLKTPSDLLLSAREISISPLCLMDGEAQACIEADRFPDKGAAELDLKGLGMERLRPLLPPEIEEFTGVLDAKAHADLSTPMKASLEVTLRPGVLVYLDPESRPIRLEHRDGKITASYDEKGLAANWNIELGEHRADGTLSVPRQALDADPQSAPLKGDINVAVTELGLVQAFVPEIGEIEGHVDVALKLTGTLGNPAVSGHATLESSKVLIPLLGLDLKDILVQAQGGDGRNLKLTGRILSGEGGMNLDGVVMLDAAREWPAKVTLKGDNFQLANVPEAQVIVSTDMKLESTKELIRVRGKLEVPTAIVEIHDLPPGSRDVSPDTVIVGEEEGIGAEAAAKLDAEVVVLLGERVHFSGFGLNVDLGGKLTVKMKGSKSPTANGELKVLSGSYRAYGQDLTIQKGRISWAGGNIANPLLRLQAIRKFDQTVVGVRVSGTARKPEFTTFSSDPDITEKEALSMLLTGQKGTDLSQASVYAGKQISPDLSVGVNLGGGDRGTEFVARYRLRDNVTLEGTSSAKKSGASINYTFEID